MRWLVVIAFVACSEPAPPPESEPEPTVEEAPPEPVAPEFAAIPSASLGQAQVAVPTPAGGTIEFPMHALDAGFGRDDSLVLIELKPEDGSDAPSIQLTYHGSDLETGTQSVFMSRSEDVFTVAIGRSQLRPSGGEINITAVDDEHLAATVELEVRHPLDPRFVTLRARFDARRDAFYDASISHQRAIRQQLKRR